MFVATAIALSAAIGCATPPPQRTTRLADADLTQAVLTVREQLAESAFLRSRDETSPEARLVVRRVENLSTDRIAIAEQWSLVLRLLAAPNTQELLQNKRIVVQLPPEKVRLLERGGLRFDEFAQESWPTHMLKAQIASATRAGSLAGSRDADVRKEYYLLSFAIEEIQSRELVWQGTTEVAREVRGSVID
ncbi:MAG: hypothetical protein Q9O74_08615 [Planctomycetota bacterium]|nr:hypothetical protein [Planctomycetota bacterium]